MHIETEQTAPEQELIRWRHQQLALAGFPAPAAMTLAEDPHYDLHALIELVERGCPPGLAVRILAPLDAGRAT